MMTKGLWVEPRASFILPKFRYPGDLVMSRKGVTVMPLFVDAGDRDLSDKLEASKFPANSHEISN
jgi:hypothetical protein